MKDYHIRIENGHHVVDMDYNPTELELAVENVANSFSQLGKTINSLFELRERIVNNQ